MKNLASAFVKAKKAFAPALKTSINPHFKSKYADLSACIEAVDSSFLDNGIAMYQETFEDQSGVTIETVLLHESGEVLRCGKLHVPASKQDPQGYGSALSYARRYSLMAACGIAPEDDDGNAAIGKGREAKVSTNVQTIPKPEGKMLEEEIQKHIAAMSKATTAGALETRATAALEAATDVRDRDAYKRFRSCAADLQAALEQAA